MHTQLSQTARQRKLDKKTFFIFFFLPSFLPLLSQFLQQSQTYFFGSYFNVMAEAVGREMQMVRINGDCREFHGVKKPCSNRQWGSWKSADV